MWVISLKLLNITNKIFNYVPINTYSGYFSVLDI